MIKEVETKINKLKNGEKDKDIVNNQKELDPNISALVNENFWDLVNNELA